MDGCVWRRLLCFRAWAGEVPCSPKLKVVACPASVGKKSAGVCTGFKNMLNRTLEMSGFDLMPTQALQESLEPEK